MPEIQISSPTSDRKKGDSSMMPTNTLVAEIIELDNDESPRKAKMQNKGHGHMGF